MYQVKKFSINAIVHWTTRFKLYVVSLQRSWQILHFASCFKLLDTCPRVCDSLLQKISKRTNPVEGPPCASWVSLVGEK